MANLYVAVVSAFAVIVGVHAQLDSDNSTFVPVSARQGYPAEDESTLNSVINSLIQGAYQYVGVMAYFERDDQDLRGFSKFFERFAWEKREAAMKLMDWQTRRGGVVSLGAVPAPAQSTFGKGLDAFQLALNNEKQNYDTLISAYAVAVKNTDPELAFDMEKEVHHATKKIKEIAGIVRDLQRADFKSNRWGGDSNFGEYHVDHDLERKEIGHAMHTADKICIKHHKKHGKDGKKH